MIKANELRIGNLVQRPERLIIDALNEPKYYGVNITMLRDCEHYGKDWAFEGIPLTKDWVKKFGFFKFNNAWVVTKPNEGIKFQFSLWEDLSYNTGELKPPLEYVHQLQNLYFVLTGKELKLSLLKQADNNI